MKTFEIRDCMGDPHTCIFQFHRYQEGGKLAVRILEIEGDPSEPSDIGLWATLSVNLSKYPIVLGAFIVKNYSENSTLDTQLLALGLIESACDHGVYLPGVGVLPICQLTPLGVEHARNPEMLEQTLESVGKNSIAQSATL